MVRSGRAGNRLHRSRRLFQQLCVDYGAQMEASRLRWLRNNQTKIRADTYKGLTDAIRNDDVLADTGKQVILPSSHVGSDRAHGSIISGCHGYCSGSWKTAFVSNHDM